MTQATATDTRDVIISAAFACFRTQGLRKTTIVDIAKAADVSRSTFYEYFRDKETIVEACAEAASQRFYRNMAKAIDRHGGSTLEGRLVRAAVFVTQARQVVEPEAYFDQEEVNLMMTKNAATLLAGVRRVPRAVRVGGQVDRRGPQRPRHPLCHRVVRANVVLAVHHSVAEHRHARRRRRRSVRAALRRQRIRRGPLAGASVACPPAIPYAMRYGHSRNGSDDYR